MTCLTVWKRFNEIKRLRKNITKRHKELHLRGTVPDIVEHNYFKRFDPAVIQERKEYILKLLDFIAQQPCLYKSHAFIHFFEGSHTPTESPGRRRTSNIESICDAIDVPFQQEYNLIDPHKDNEEEQDFADDCAERSHSSSLLSNSTSSDSILVPHVQAVEATETDGPATSVSSVASMSPLSVSLSSSPEILSVSQSNKDLFAPLNNGVVTAISPATENILHTITTSIDIDASDYIYEAALQFSEAVQAEVSMEYRLSFERYKTGISILINGAKHDVREERKRIAKDKIQKYLARAEQIHEQYLANGIDELDGTDNSRRDSTNAVRTSESRWSIASVAEEYSMELPINQLSKYKVIKVLQSVMQVQDVTDKKVYIMKVSFIKIIKNNIIPTSSFILVNTIIIT